MEIRYVVTAQMPAELAGDWASWMEAEHIPDVLATGMFQSCILLRDIAEPGKFVVQYTAASLRDYERYRAEFAPALQASHRERYGSAVATSRMELSVLKEFTGVRQAD